MKRKIIAINGYSCAGKTTVIEAIKEQINCDILKFGEIHKECVKKNGYSYAKDWIKLEGFEAYEKQLLIFFKNMIKSKIGNSELPIVIDGIFSDKCFKLISEIDGIDFSNIVLETEYGIRIERMMNRQNMNYEEAVEHMYNTDLIKESAGIGRILKEFDYKIDGNKTKEEVRKICFSILKGLEFPEKIILEEKRNEDIDR